MPKKRSWTIQELTQAVALSKSNRQVLFKIGLRTAGGNYEQLNKYIRENNLDTSHFHGQAWNKGRRGLGKPLRALSDIVVKNSDYQSYKLKMRLIKTGLKKNLCEHCGWSEKTKDGYTPLELDHINGDRHDNRLENLRVLCPNCHSLTPTYRGRGKRKL